MRKHDSFGTITFPQADLKEVAFDISDIEMKVKYESVDYLNMYTKKRKGLHDMVGDGDGFTREEIHDLVLTANKAVWQQSYNE